MGSWSGSGTATASVFEMRFLMFGIVVVGGFTVSWNMPYKVCKNFVDVQHYIEDFDYIMVATLTLVGLLNVVCMFEWDLIGESSRPSSFLPVQLANLEQRRSRSGNSVQQNRCGGRGNWGGGRGFIPYLRWSRGCCQGFVGFSGWVQPSFLDPKHKLAHKMHIDSHAQTCFWFFCFVVLPIIFMLHACNLARVWYILFPHKQKDETWSHRTCIGTFGV